MVAGRKKDRAGEQVTPSDQTTESPDLSGLARPVTAGSKPEWSGIKKVALQLPRGAHLGYERAGPYKSYYKTKRSLNLG